MSIFKKGYPRFLGAFFFPCHFNKNNTAISKELTIRPLEGAFYIPRMATDFKLITAFATALIRPFIITSLALQLSHAPY